MRKVIFIIYTFISIHCLGTPSEVPNEITYLVDVTWASKYMMGGYKIGGDHSVFEIAAKINFYHTGLSLMAWTAVQAERENKEFDEQDIFAMYSKDYFADSIYKTNFHAFADYWQFPYTKPVIDPFGDVVSTSIRKGNKFQVGISMLHLIPFYDSHLVPTYNIYRWVYYAQDRADLNQGGDQHELLLEYFRPIEIFFPGATYQYAGGTSSLNYNTGAFAVKPGLSHATLAGVTGVYAFNSIFETSLNYQWSFQNLLSKTNDLWTTLSFIRKF